MDTTTTTNPSFTIVTGGRDNYEFEVHAAGCKDLTKQKNVFLCDQLTQTAVSAAALVDEEVAEYAAQDQGWNHDHFKIHACAKKLTATKRTAKPVEEIVAETTELIYEDATPEAALVELARRAHNKLAKKNDEMSRLEAPSDWAFAASSDELKSLVAA